MKIPKTIKILGHKITVYWSNGALELDDDTGCRGLAHLLTNKIGLSRQIEGDELTESRNRSYTRSRTTSRTSSAWSLKNIRWRELPVAFCR